MMPSARAQAAGWDVHSESFTGLHLGFYKSKLRIWWCCSRTSLQHSLFFLNIAAFFFPFSFKTFLRLSSYFPPVFLWAFCTSHKPSRQKSPLTRLIFSISRLFSVFPGYFQYFHAVQSWGLLWCLGKAHTLFILDMYQIKLDMKSLGLTEDLWGFQQALQ